MALKYWFEFTDVKAIVHKVEIYNDDFVGDSTQIYGSCSLNKASTKDTLESIRGGGLRIDLEANLNLTFSDFYSENERNFSVKYLRNNIELFFGWLSPEGLFQSFVNDKWIISLDCTDGLGFLKNLSYVENATGLPFIGKQSGLDIIVNCLKRTDLQQNIYSKIDIAYDGMTITENVLANTYFNANRFVKEDRGNTYMNCDEVLRSVLEPFGACITQSYGSWYIYKPNELVYLTSFNMFAYDSNGLPLIPAKVSVDLSAIMGSQINNFYPHHVNSNQQLTIDSSIGAYRINYKYGLVKSFFTNLDLQNISGVVDEWTVDDTNSLQFPTNDLGFILDTIPHAIPTSSTTLVLTSDSFNFAQDNVLRFNATCQFYEQGGITGKIIAFIYFKVILTDGVDTYYLDDSGEWVNSDTFISVQLTAQLRNLTIQSNSIPIDGAVSVEIYRPIRLNTQGTAFDDAIITQCGFSPIDSGLDNVKGENHTFQVNENPSTKIEKVKEVFNGDNPSDSFLGTIYKSDQATPTELWKRLKLFYQPSPWITRNVPLLQIMGEERMKMYAKPLRVFSGDIFGYIDYLSVISIDGINNTLFMPIEYEYNAQENITKLKLKQILDYDLIPLTTSDKIDYQLAFDYGNVVEPTIVG
tara:strand:+ start:362 stop:2278 length:1917 start_codon:yes stop_codon:yes gene_type:complete